MVSSPCVTNRHVTATSPLPHFRYSPQGGKEEAAASHPALPVCCTTRCPLTPANTKSNRTVKMQLENSPFMLKPGISQYVEVIARVFWAPGSQDLPTVGKQICWNVHRTCPDPTSSGHEHTAVVWCGTTTIVFHVAGRESILSEARCPILRWGPELVPPPWAVWCGVDAPVCSVVPRSRKLYRHHLSPTVPHRRVKTKCHL